MWSVTHGCLYTFQVLERIKTIWTNKLSVSEKVHGELGLPRIVRLARKFKLSEKETQVIIYAFISKVTKSKSFLPNRLVDLCNKQVSNTHSKQVSNTHSKQVSNTHSKQVSNTHSKQVSNTHSKQVSNTHSKQVSNTHSK